jgi:hypothetical protein
MPSADSRWYSVNEVAAHWGVPKDKPCLILMDEVINYTSTYRHKG